MQDFEHRLRRVIELQKCYKIPVEVMAIEEMAELTKELMKNVRGRENIKEIIEESTDVLITVMSILIEAGATKEMVVGIMNDKINRAILRMS